MVTVAKRQKRVTVFGQRLRALREAVGLTQTELGNRAGMPYQTIAKYERGEIEPNWPSVLDIAAALGVPTDSFRDPDVNADQAPDPIPEYPAGRRGGKKK